MPSETKINFLPDEERSKPAGLGGNAGLALNAKKLPNFSLTKLVVFLAVAFLIIFAALASILAFSKNHIFDNMSGLNLLGQVGQLITSADKPLIGEDQDRVNVLVMGIGGENHDGGNLTDTMILMSFKPSTQQIAMMSIPRDLYVKSAYGWNKINAINAYAEQKNPGSGGPEAAKAVSDLLGIPIPYYVTVDFDGFEKLIDEFGGVDVMVDNDLIDYQYPIRGREDAYPISSRFEKLAIKKGPQHFDGATALKYARSRHALGAEGSDFARSKRQQKIILALKDKILSAQTLFSQSKISSLLDAYKSNIHTNLQLWEMLRIYKLSKDINFNQIIHIPLDDSPQGMLYSTKLNGAYVLLPDGGNFAKIRAVWTNVFVSTSTDFKATTTNDDANLASEIERLNKQEAQRQEQFKVMSSTPATTTPASAPATTTDLIIDQINESPDQTSAYEVENAKIEIRNGTQVEGWATTEKSKLVAKGFNVASVGNAPTRSYKGVSIYNLSDGNFPATSRALANLYGVSVSSSRPPFASNADFLIILGK